MPSTNSLVPATNHHPVDIENQQSIQAAPKRYNKAVTFAKLGAMAGVCAVTSGLMLADLAKMHNITLPVQHTPGRELLDIPVNGTCPEGKYLFNKEMHMKRAKTLMIVGGAVFPGLVILSGVGLASLSRLCSENWENTLFYPLATIGGLSLGGIIFILPVGGGEYAYGKNKVDGQCYNNRPVSSGGRR